MFFKDTLLCKIEIRYACTITKWKKKNEYNYWVVRKIRAAKDLNLINEIKNLNLLRFNFPSKSNFPDNSISFYETNSTV